MFAVFKATEDVAVVLPGNCSMLTYLCRPELLFQLTELDAPLSGKYSDGKTEVIMDDITYRIFSNFLILLTSTLSLPLREHH